MHREDSEEPEGNQPIESDRQEVVDSAPTAGDLGESYEESEEEDDINY